MFDYERRPDWTARWAEFIKDSLDLQPELCLDWEFTSCTSFAAQGIEAITGRNPFEEGEWDGKFTTPLSAAKEIKRRGFLTLDDVIASLFVEIPLAFAWPGDVVLVRALPWSDEEARSVMPHGVGLVDPPYYYSPAELGLGRGDLYKEAVRAFAIGHGV